MITTIFAYTTIAMFVAIILAFIYLLVMVGWCWYWKLKLHKAETELFSKRLDMLKKKVNILTQGGCCIHGRNL